MMVIMVAAAGFPLCDVFLQSDEKVKIKTGCSLLFYDYKLVWMTMVANYGLLQIQEFKRVV